MNKTREKFESIYSMPPYVEWGSHVSEYVATVSSRNVRDEARQYTSMFYAFCSGQKAASTELREALNETLTDLIGYQINARKAAKGDSAWEGVAEAIQPTIDQARAALAKATGGGE